MRPKASAARLREGPLGRSLWFYDWSPSGQGLLSEANALDCNVAKTRREKNLLRAGGDSRIGPDPDGPTTPDSSIRGSDIAADYEPSIIAVLPDVDRYGCDLYICAHRRHFLVLTRAFSKLRQLGDIDRDPPRLVVAERRGRGAS